MLNQENPQDYVGTLTEQMVEARAVRMRCSRGEHEEADDELYLGEFVLQYCRHCRCLFVGR